MIEQTRIVTDNTLYRQAVKAQVFPGSLAFQQALAGVDRMNDGRDKGMCISPLSGPPMEKQQEKTYEKTTLFVIHHRFIIFALGVFFGYLLLFEVPVMAGKAAFHPFSPFDEDGF